MERKKEENQKVTLDVTEKLIVERGIRVITIENMAQKTDLATGTTYLLLQ